MILSTQRSSTLDFPFRENLLYIINSLKPKGFFIFTIVSMKAD